MQVCVKASVEIASGTVSAAARKAGGSHSLKSIKDGIQSVFDGFFS